MEKVAAAQILGDRTTQEDAVRVNRQSADGDGSDLLLLLSDGMGGHSGGEVASNIVVDAFLDHFQDGSTNMRPGGRLRESLDVANAALTAEVKRTPELKGMGCTLIAMLSAAGRYVWVSVGDSVLFLLRDGRLRRLNADHSYFSELKELVARGELTMQEAESHPKKNALLSVLSGAPIKMVDSNVIESEPGDVLILASDGLETLTDGDIAKIARNKISDGPTAVSNALLGAVADRQRPKQDNTSVIVMEVPGGGVADFGENTQWNVRPKSFFERPIGLITAAAAGALVTGLLVAWFLRDDAPDTTTTPETSGAAETETSPEPEGGADVPGGPIVEEGPTAIGEEPPSDADPGDGGGTNSDENPGTPGTPGDTPAEEGEAEDGPERLFPEFIPREVIPFPNPDGPLTIPAPAPIGGPADSIVPEVNGD